MVSTWGNTLCILRRQYDHAALWGECVRLATTSAAGIEMTKRVRTENQVESEMDTTELGADDCLLADDHFADDDLADGSDDDTAELEREREVAEQPYGRVVGQVFVAANDGECDD